VHLHSQMLIVSLSELPNRAYDELAGGDRHYIIWSFPLPMYLVWMNQWSGIFCLFFEVLVGLTQLIWMLLCWLISSVSETASACLELRCRVTLFIVFVNIACSLGLVSCLNADQRNPCLRTTLQMSGAPQIFLKWQATWTAQWIDKSNLEPGYQCTIVQWASIRQW
jgi:hypothetical protein